MKPQARETITNEASPAAGHRILVVDDNRDAAGSLAMLLQMAGNETHVAHDGAEGFLAAETVRPDIVVEHVALTKVTAEARRKPA